MDDKKRLAEYWISRTTVKSYCVSAGLQSVNWDNSYVGSLPTKLFICFVDSDSYNGSFDKSPFNFQSFGCTSIGCYINNQSKPFSPLSMTFEDGHYVSALCALYDNCRTTVIDRDRFKNGYCIFCFDLQGHGGKDKPKPDSDMLPLKMQGSIKINVRFKEPLAKPIHIIALGISPGTFSIDITRNIIYEAD